MCSVNHVFLYVLSSVIFPNLSSVYHNFNIRPQPSLSLLRNIFLDLSDQVNIPFVYDSQDLVIIPFLAIIRVEKFHFLLWFFNHYGFFFNSYTINIFFTRQWNTLNMLTMPWLANRCIGWCIVLYTRKLQVQFPVRAHS